MFLIRKAHQFPPEGFFIFVLFLLVYVSSLLAGHFSKLKNQLTINLGYWMVNTTKIIGFLIKTG